MSIESPEGGEGGSDEWWKTWYAWILNNPWDFLCYACIGLCPLIFVFIISSWKFFKRYQTQGNSKDKKRSPKKISSGAGKGKSSRTLRSNASKGD